MADIIRKSNKNNGATPEGQKADFDIRRLLASIRVWDYYYIIVAVCYVLTVFVSAMHPGVVASLLMVLVGIAAAIVGLGIGRDKGSITVKGLAASVKSLPRSINMCDVFALAFVIYNVISVIWLRMSGMPLYVYTGELVVFILPAVFYIVGRVTETSDGMYKGFLMGLFIICGAGLLFYITAPQFYLDYLYDWSYISLADASTMRVRMQSVCGSTILGSISVMGMLAGAGLFANGRYKKIGISGFFVGFVFAFLSNQRSAMVVAIIVAVYINCLAFFTFKLFKKKYFFYECAGVVVVFVGLLAAAPGVLLKIYYRLESLPLAIGERSEQWVAAVNMMFSSWIGNGLGANGHRAIGIEGVKVIADGGLVKLFCEDGVIGLSIFIYLLILIYKGGIKVLHKCFAELGIIGIILLQSVGSNVLSFQLVTPIFWYAIGRSVRVISKSSDNCEDANENGEVQS